MVVLHGRVYGSVTWESVWLCYMGECMVVLHGRVYGSAAESVW